MSVINSQPLIGASGNQSTAYNLTRSLRFRSSASAYLNRTPASAGNRQRWTWSAWVKRGALGATSTLFAARGASTPYTQLQINSDNTLYFYDDNATISTTQVFRDPSSWYHLVLQVDTTQATASNRIRIYVNGSQVTALSNTTYPSQNANLNVNATVNHGISGNPFDGNYFDGYMAEINFVDGSALTPSDFGETDTATGVWKPKKYTGTYGTNGFYLPFRASSTSSYAASFNGSSQFLYLGGQSNFAFGSGDFTVEMWINPTSTSAGVLYDSRPTSTNGFYPMMYFDTNVLYYYVNGNNEITVSGIKTGVWTHIALVKNSGSTRIYVNGVQAGSTYTDGNTYLNGADRPMIGRAGFTSTGFVNGFISNLRVVKGTAVYTSSFTPPSEPLTAIANTQLLTLQNSTIVDNSTNAFTITNSGSVTTSVQYPFASNIGADVSGNNNNWTPNNISLVNGATYDSMKDVPTLTDADTANYCVINAAHPPVVSSGGTYSISNGNLSAAAATATKWMSTVGTFQIPVGSGKWYFEFVPQQNGADYSYGVGMFNVNNANLTNAVFFDQSGGLGYSSSGQKVTGGTYTSYGASWGVSGDIIGVAIDASGSTTSIEFYKNNTSQGVAFSGLTGTYVPAFGNAGANAPFSVNFGQRPFAYTPPSGFKALNTFNLPTPTIGATASTQANDYFDVNIWTGNGSTQNIVNSGAMQPDLVWYKSRSNSGYDHYLIDSVRGTTKWLGSSSTSAEQTVANSLTAFNSNGFTLGSDAGGNQNTLTYVGWQWRASGSTVSNTAGSQTSTVSVNTSAGFSIATFTCTGLNVNGTVGHGLGVAPNMIITKSRGSGSNWVVYHSSVSTDVNKFLRLNDTSALTTLSQIWGDALPTSTVFGIRGDVTLVANATAVAYCFAEVAGYSKFGSYTGNGSADGPFIYLGFRPKFLLIKSSSVSATSWLLLDSSRNTFNIVNSYLIADGSGAEGTYAGWDFVSNGFKIRNTAANGSGETVIYAAFAENPFKYSLAR